jgi:ribosomal protein L30/L7E
VFIELFTKVFSRCKGTKRNSNSTLVSLGLKQLEDKVVNGKKPPIEKTIIKEVVAVKEHHQFVGP